MSNILLRKDNSQSGQTIIVVFMVMLIALVVGMTLSTRFINTMKILSRSDDSSRAIGVAEALVERFLLLPRSTIEDYTTNGNCGADCTLSITGDNGQVLTAQITLSYLGDTSDNYEILVHEGNVEEISLVGYTGGSSVDVCWTTDASVYASYVYDDSGVVRSNAYAVAPLDTTYVEDNFDPATASYGFNSCFTVDTVESPRILRIKPYRGSADIKVVPAPGEVLPIQGILISSRGTAGETQKEVNVLLTNSTVPELFDYILFQKSEVDPLSNLGN